MVEVRSAYRWRRSAVIALVAMIFADLGYLVWAGVNGAGNESIAFALLAVCLALSLMLAIANLDAPRHRLSTILLAMASGAAVLAAAFEIIDLSIRHWWGDAYVSRLAAARILALQDWVMLAPIAAQIIAAPWRWSVKVLAMMAGFVAISLTMFTLGPPILSDAPPSLGAVILLGGICLFIGIQVWLYCRRARPTQASSQV